MTREQMVILFRLKQDPKGKFYSTLKRADSEHFYLPAISMKMLVQMMNEGPKI